jgi:hypothetical protein
VERVLVENRHGEKEELMRYGEEVEEGGGVEA